MEDCFLRTSDDCIAIYGSRWDNRGDSRDITVRRTAVWADVAHPLMIGTHGDHENEGDVIEHILYEDVDILEHHEFQSGYLGAMAINAGDKNTVRHVTYRNIRVEAFEHGNTIRITIRLREDGLRILYLRISTSSREQVRNPLSLPGILRNMGWTA